MSATLKAGGTETVIEGRGNGPIDAFVDALKSAGIAAIEVLDYREHALTGGANAQAAAYVEARTADGRILFGVGVDRSIVDASLRAVTSAAARVRLN